MKLRPETRELLVGVTAIALFLLIYGGFQYSRSYKEEIVRKDWKVLFSDIGTLKKGNVLKVGGVEKGRVKDMELTDTGVIVHFNLHKAVRVPRDSRLLIQNSGFMGERMITLDLGNSSSFYTPDDLINGNYESGISEAVGLIADVLHEASSSFNQVLEIFGRSFGSNEFKKSASDIKKGLGRITGGLRRIKKRNAPELKQSIDNLEAIVNGISKTASYAEGRLANAGNDIKISAEQGEKIFKRLNTGISALDSLVKSLSDAETPAGAVLGDPEFREDLRLFTSELKNYLEDARDKGVDMNVAGFSF
ncbi:MAG: MlaD family protein [Fibrobacterota bacterium]